MLCMENSSVLTCEQALGETWAGIEGEPARMAVNFKWRVQILDAKHWLAEINSTMTSKPCQLPV